MEVVEKKAHINDENNKRKVGYYICDNLSLFYYRYIFKHSSQLKIMDLEVFYDKYIDEDINNLFIEGLVENNTEKLLLVPKSDLHNHSTKGCRREWIEEKIGRSITKQPEKLCCNLILFEIYWNGIDMAF